MRASHLGLRRILQGAHCLRGVSVFDPMSARIALELEFGVGLLGGSVASLAVLGAPDWMLITLTELVQQTRRVCRAAPGLCLLVDADNGYGNALNVIQAVEELGVAGAAGLSIEDTVFLGGPSAPPTLASIGEVTGKLRAAVDARGEGGPLVFARTGAMACGGIDDAINRLRAYEEAGVDALFLPYLKCRSHLDAIASAVRLPLVLAACDSSLSDLGYLSERRVRLWVSGHQPFVVATQAMYDCMRQLRDGVPAERLTSMPSSGLMALLMREAEYAQLHRRYITP